MSRLLRGIRLGAVSVAALFFAAALCQPQRKSGANRDTPEARSNVPGPEPSAPQPAPVTLPGPLSPEGPSGPSGPLSPVEAMMLASALTVEGDASIQGTGVSEPEGKRRERTACRLRSELNPVMADLRAIAAKLCAIEAIGKRLQIGKRYSNISQLNGLSVLVERPDGTTAEKTIVNLCENGEPLARVVVEQGTNGRLKGKLEARFANLSGVAGTLRTLVGTFDAGHTEEGRTTLSLESYEKTFPDRSPAMRRVEASLRSDDVSRIAVARIVPKVENDVETSLARERLAARFSLDFGAILAKKYDGDLKGGDLTSSFVDAGGGILEQSSSPDFSEGGALHVEAGELPSLLSVAPLAFDDGAFQCDGEKLDFAMTSQEFIAYDACDAKLIEPFAPYETCESDAFVDPAKTRFTCPSAEPEGC